MAGRTAGAFRFGTIPALAGGISGQESMHLRPRPVPLQRKLQVGAVDDPLEEQAEQMAQRVMRMPAPGPVQRKCAACQKDEEEHAKLARKTVPSAPQAMEAPPSVHTVLQQPGSPLDPGARGFFESRFGRNFASVRIHADEQSAESARSVAARAYTVGNHIAFAHGEFSPHSDSGRSLLAHELAHVCQQGGGSSVLARVPTRKGVENDDYSFSANCGWIDWGHANPGFAKRLIDAVQQASDALKAGAAATPGAGSFSSPTMQASKAGVIFSSASMQIKLARALSPDEVLAVSLSLFKNISVVFEIQQEWTDWFSGSAFSQEDLPSNMISFYRAAKGFTQDQIKKFCGAQDRTASLSEFDARHDFQKNKTFTPVGATGAWPADLSSIDENKGSTLYTVQSANVGGPVNRTYVCPLYRIEGTIDATDLFIISVGGTEFTKADDVQVVPTYQVDPDRVSGRGSFPFIQVKPFRQSDIDAFKRNDLSYPIWVSSLDLVCLEQTGAGTAATLRRAADPASGAAEEDKAGRDFAPALVSQTLEQPGVPLAPEMRALMEPRFGQSFAAVRVHTDAAAAQSARAIGARAYTLGNHIVFAQGQAPSSAAGSRRLLAHELAHVVQQRSPSFSRAAQERSPVQRDPDATAPAVNLWDRIASEVFHRASYNEYLQKDLTSTTFFGQTLNNLNDQMIQALKAAEADLVQSQGASYKPKRADSTLRQKGGMHGWGMAVDFDVEENPYVLNESGEGKLDPELRAAYDHVAQFMLGKTQTDLRKLKQGRSAFGSGSISDVYDRLSEESSAMKRYFAMKDDATALNTFLTAEWPAKHPGETAPAASAVQAQMKEDYEVLGGKTSSGGKRATGGTGDRPFAPTSGGGRGDPATGFLNLDKPFVLAMTNAGLGWGAIDIQGEPGDIQHFDTRLSGTGKTVYDLMMKYRKP
ncbi:MAG TPA: DUF4157 domain-containing protein [Acidobacteriaceae bacterium]|nr:DUF4157 domain-containing protein [Acidobacteriaceae bacterium]